MVARMSSAEMRVAAGFSWAAARTTPATRAAASSFDMTISGPRWDSGLVCEPMVNRQPGASPVSVLARVLSTDCQLKGRQTLGNPIAGITEFLGDCALAFLRTLQRILDESVCRS